MLQPRHAQAEKFAVCGIFHGLKSFAELENRIHKLPSDQDKGACFEVFAEAYLATQRKHDVQDIWPSSAIPTDISQRVSLPLKDMGADGIYRALLASLCAYQVKFRSGRPSLSWRELSTFFGIADSPSLGSRVLITNCDELAEVVNQRQRFFCIRGSDLDRLTEADLSAIAAWVGKALVQYARNNPLPHQGKALDCLLPALRACDRVSAIMACGTGKTLVALWIMEGLENVRRVLVLLPSLVLVRQTLHVWLHETRLEPLPYLCVCSDPSVKPELDLIVLPQVELDFEVTTNPDDVRAFLAAPFSGTKVVFSTYQSANVIGKALSEGDAFDLGIFDEAHKTAGSEGRNFAFALEDSNLPIRKRLFLTATPRHYNPHKRSEQDESKLVFSMNRPKVYGKQEFQLPFAKAADQGIICHYKVIISVITQTMVDNQLLQTAAVKVGKDLVRARQVANQIALLDAVKKYNLRKIFTFHKDVKSAQSFVAEGDEGIGSHLKGFKTFHVNGKMKTSYREKLLGEFRDSEAAVMSNARCLTEGVDVPSVDMVAFLSPRRSRVDIVQATGRAMRKAPGKETGYVLVPLYLEQVAGESVEDAVARANFDEVWDVLQSLQEQDEILADIVNQAGTQVGMKKGFDDARIAERIEFCGEALSLEALRKAVTTRCLRNLWASWDEFYGRLLLFKEQFGHCNVQTDFEDESLWRWVSQQRTRKKNNQLSEDRVQRLNAIGFEWDWQTVRGDQTWMGSYAKLEKYYAEHGNSNVPKHHQDRKLWNWVSTQRQRRRGKTKDGPLIDKQVSLLNELGFDWNPHEDRWERMFEKLRQFKEAHGHFEVDLVHGESDELFRWMRQQRVRSAKLSTERVAKLNGIGFTWKSERADLKFSKLFERLLQYTKDKGDTLVPQKFTEDSELGQWVDQLRQDRRKDLLSEQEIAALDEIGFSWSVRKRGTWESTFEELKRFKVEHGNFDVSLSEHPKLYAWITRMRFDKRKNKLTPERCELLDKLGFPW